MVWMKKYLLEDIKSLNLNYLEKLVLYYSQNIKDETMWCDGMHEKKICTSNLALTNEHCILTKKKNEHCILLFFSANQYHSLK
jgi:hypothetical protein